MTYVYYVLGTGDYPFQSLELPYEVKIPIPTFSSVQLLRRVRPCATLQTAARQASLSITNSQSLLKLMAIKSVMPSNHPILCRPLLLLPSILLSIRVFSNESVLCIRWPKNWSFSISPSDEYSRLISFRIDWFDLLAVQGTLKSLLQHFTNDQTEAQSLAHNLIAGDRGTENKIRPQPIWF